MNDNDLNIIYLEQCPLCGGNAIIRADLVNHFYENPDYKTKRKSYNVYAKCLRCGTSGQKFQTEDVFLSWESRYTSTSPRKEVFKKHLLEIEQKAADSWNQRFKI